MPKLPTIPIELLPLVQNPPLLKGESLLGYNNLLGGVATIILPADAVEWLWLFQFVDCSWEIFRNRGLRATTIDLHRIVALQDVIRKTKPGRNLTVNEFNEAITRWHKNPNEFQEYGIGPQSVTAMALWHAAPKLEAIDKTLERLYRRCDKIMQQLEFRRELFANRARLAAEAVLNAENSDGHRAALAIAPRALESPDQMKADQNPDHPNQVPIAPNLPPATAMPSGDETPPEAPSATPSSDLERKD